MASNRFCIDCGCSLIMFTAKKLRCPACAHKKILEQKRSYDKCACGKRKQSMSLLCRVCTSSLPTKERSRDQKENRDRKYDLCNCGKMKQKISKQCKSCNNETVAQLALSKSRKRDRYDFCGCGRKMKSGALRCIVCKRDEVGEEIMRDLCECGKDKILTSPYCASCTVARAINRVNQAKAIQPNPTVYHVRRKPAPPRIEYELCQCGSEWEVRKGHQCPKCYALTLRLPEPKYSQHLILDRMGNKV